MYEIVTCSLYVPACIKIQAAVVAEVPSLVKAAPKVLYVPEEPTTRQPLGAVVRTARVSSPAGAASVSAARSASERVKVPETKDNIVADAGSCEENECSEEREGSMERSDELYKSNSSFLPH